MCVFAVISVKRHWTQFIKVTLNKRRCNMKDDALKTMEFDAMSSEHIEKAEALEQAESAEKGGVLVDAVTKPLTKAEQRKRQRAVNASKALFKAIDVVFNLSQNSCPYVNNKNLETISCDENIVYDEQSPEVFNMDFYRVKTETAQPAIILIHGGGFTAGDKKYRKGQARFFSLNGFSVFCVNYGLAPEYIFPAPIKHLVTAANFIYDHAEEYNIDKQRIMVAGDSAGAYYSAILGAFNGNDKIKEFYGFAPKFRIYGALLNCGIYDIDTMLNTKYMFDVDDAVLLSFTGVNRAEFVEAKNKEYCAPVEHVTADFPPSFLIFSDGDLFCKGQGQAMVKKLDENGVYCEFYKARHGTSNHCFSLGWRGEDATAANELMCSFAKRLAAGKINLNA